MGLWKYNEFRDVEQLVKNHENSVLFKLNKPKGHPAIKDEELKRITVLILAWNANKSSVYWTPAYPSSHAQPRSIEYNRVEYDPKT